MSNYNKQYFLGNKEYFENPEAEHKDTSLNAIMGYNVPVIGTQIEVRYVAPLL